MVPLSSWDALWMQADQGGQEGEGRVRPPTHPFPLCAPSCPTASDGNSLRWQVARHAAEEITQVVLPMFAMDSAMHRFIMVTPDRKVSPCSQTQTHSDESRSLSQT